MVADGFTRERASARKAMIKVAGSLSRGSGSGSCPLENHQAPPVVPQRATPDPRIATGRKVLDDGTPRGSAVPRKSRPTERSSCMSNVAGDIKRKGARGSGKAAAAVWACVTGP